MAEIDLWESYRPQSTANDKAVAAKFSPDLNQMRRVSIDQNTNIYVDNSDKRTDADIRAAWLEKYKPTRVRFTGADNNRRRG